MKIRVKILNRLGLHARPAALLAKCAANFNSRIELTADRGTAADAKSILALLTLGATCGTELTVDAEGEDAALALNAVQQLFAAGFDEE